MEIEEFLTTWKAIQCKRKKVVLPNKVSFYATAYNIFVYHENGEAEKGNIQLHLTRTIMKNHMTQMT